MSNSSGPVIWAVEDDPSVQRLITLKLKTHGFRPVIFGNAEKAYSALVHAERPALIILDILLPGMSGVDLIRLLKQNKDWEKIPVVVVSVLSRDDDPIKSSADVVQEAYWVNKPLEADALIQTIESILAVVR